VSPEQHVLVNETKDEFEYDPERALRLWRLLKDEIPEGDDRGYVEHPNSTDDDRIVYLFELLNGSVLGDMVFGNLANFDQGSELVVRRWDE
jgi:hypothetical protein